MNNYEFKFWMEPNGDYRLQIKDMIFGLSEDHARSILDDMRMVFDE